MFLRLIIFLFGCAVMFADEFAPRGRKHIPIGIANSVDTLKTFVEAEGNYSPGFGSFGVYFLSRHATSGLLLAPTMTNVPSSHGLTPEGYLIPWTEWSAGEIYFRSEVCQVEQQPNLQLVGSRVFLRNESRSTQHIDLLVAIRPVGAAGNAITNIRSGSDPRFVMVNDRVGLYSVSPPNQVLLLKDSSFSEQLMSPQNGTVPGADSAVLQFQVTLKANETRTFGFVSPVHPGRRVTGHQWDGKSKWAQFDEAPLFVESGGQLQGNPPESFYAKLNVDSLFTKARAYWADLTGRTRFSFPDPRWTEAFSAMIGHVAMNMNEGAPDVSVINYNVFNRDGVYIANIFQKAGHFELAEKAIDYFIKHPFNGRVEPEADNPGQILWIMGEHWLFTRNKKWAERIYPAARQIAGMIRYYRTTPGPHYVDSQSLNYGEAVLPEARQILKPGSCDGFHPEYTEAFDIAGLRAAALLARALEKSAEAREWESLADQLMLSYDVRFGKDLPREYGSYSVLWPCRLYPLEEGKGWEQFKKFGAQQPTDWRYFPLARAHQGLLAGNRAAGFETLDIHLAHEQMLGWYAFDEGGPSGTGGWNRALTKWQQGKESVAMPHGWAIAELHLLMRDSLLFENGNRLVLFAGVSPGTLRSGGPILLNQFPTYFGMLNLEYAGENGEAVLKLGGRAKPSEGFLLRLPPELNATVETGGKEVPGEGDFILPPGTTKATIRFPR
ncbi:MAG: hypothetical protein SFY81_00140 [Verrucomicrobiota bacterium]|nr:hypothetical protein [Verrucomicrobiota bacterium]